MIGEWEMPQAFLLEVVCFERVPIADNYGVLCIVTANGNFGCLAGCGTLLKGRKMRLKRGWKRLENGVKPTAKLAEISVKQGQNSHAEPESWFRMAVSRFDWR